MLCQNDLDWFGLELVCYAHRITPQMSAYELREALKGLPGSENLTIALAANGNQLISIGDRILEVAPMASNDEIILALQNPFIRTENTKMALLDINPGDVKATLQRIKDRQAGALTKLATLAIKSDHVANTLEGIVDTADKQLDSQLHEAGQFSNLGPDLEPHT